MTARGLLLTAVALVAFAANSLLTRAALGAHLIDPLAFGGIRFASGALLIGLIAARRARPWGGSWAAALALLAYVIPFSLGYGRIGAGVGALLLFGSVQATMIARGLVAGHRPTLREWAGLALAIAGLFALVLPGARAPDGLGALFMIAAGIAWGAYSLLGRGARDPVAATADNFVRLLPASLLRRNKRLVVMDMDSTLIRIEVIDELARAQATTRDIPIRGPGPWQQREGL